MLHVVASLLFAASAIVVVAAFFSPSTVLDAAMNERVDRAAPTADRADGTRSLDEFAPLWERPIGRPLQDPPAEAKPAKKNRQPRKRVKQSSKLNLRLIGTVLESGKSMAILSDAEGNILLGAKGQTLHTAAGSVEVESIELDQVKLSLGDATL